jgi:hypothetical protein
VLTAEQWPAVAELKLSIVDVKCTDACSITYVVEMQVLQVEGFEKRVVYNVAKAYVNQSALRWTQSFGPRGQVLKVGSAPVCDLSILVVVSSRL